VLEIEDLEDRAFDLDVVAVLELIRAENVNRPFAAGVSDVGSGWWRSGNTDYSGLIWNEVTCSRVDDPSTPRARARAARKRVGARP
jgi:hypothetical protein